MNRFLYRKGLIALIFAIVAIAPFVAYQHAADAATTPSITTNKSTYFPGVIGDGTSRSSALFEDQIIITVRDGDSNTDTTGGNNQATCFAVAAAPTGCDEITLTVTSAVGGGTVTKTLRETGSSTSIFTDNTGIKFVTSSLSQAGASFSSTAALLITRPSDTVTLRLTNVSGNTGTASVNVRSTTGSFTGSSTTILGTSNTAMTATNARIVLTDPDLNRSPTDAESFPVSLSSQLAASSITVTLTETGVNTGVFTRSGRIVNSDATGAASNSDTSLTQPAVSSSFMLPARTAGDTITVAYSSAAVNNSASIAGNSDVTDAFTLSGTSQTITYGLGTQGTIVLSGTSFLRGNRVSVTITDPDLNTSPSAINSFTQAGGDSGTGTTIGADGNVYVQDSAGTNLIAINTLTETGLSTGIFTGSFTFTSATVTDATNAISGLSPGTFTVFYDDVNPGSTAAGIVSSSFQFNTSTGTLSLSPSAFQNRTIMTATLTDSDLNTGDTGIQTSTLVTITSLDQLAATSTVTPSLTETGVSTGIFTGTFTINMGSGTTDFRSGGTNLDTTSTGTATATYTDTINSAGATSVITATASAGQNPGILSVNATSFLLTGVATLTLSDPDLNTSSASVQSNTSLVVVTNTSQPTVTTQSLFMRETGADTSLFTGTLGFTTSSSAPRSGSSSLSALIQVLPGNSIRVRYTDAAPSGTSDVNLTVPSNTGTISMDTTIIQNQSSATVSVTDPDLNSSASAAQTTTVEINSTTSVGTPITVTLTETGIDTGIFSGTFATIGDGTDSGTAITAADSIATPPTLAVSNGDGVTATYSDQQDASGSVRSVTVSRTVRFTDGNMQILTSAGAALTNNTAQAGDTVLLRYTDPDVNTNAGQVQSITASFFSTTELTGISVIMFETGANTGIFEKSILLSSTTSAASTSLRVSAGDTITARFVDTTPANAASGVTSDGVARTGTATIAAPGAPVLTPETATIGIAETLQLTAAGAGPFTFSTSDTGIASVSSAGLVTGVAAGTASITVRSTTTNLTDTTTISVVAGPAVVTGTPGSGDFGGDGVTTASDALAVLNAFATGQALTSAQIAAVDLNGDGRVNSTDALRILLQVAAATPSAQLKAAKKSTAKEQEVGAVVIRASSVSADRGATGVRVSITPSVAIPRLGSISALISYDRNILTARSATAPTGFTGSPDISTAGTVRVGLAAFPGVDIAANGSIVDITFDVSSTATLGDSSISITLQALDQAPATATGDIVNLLPNATAQAGTLTVTAPVPPIVLPHFVQSTGAAGFHSFLFLGNSNETAADVTIRAWPVGGGTAVTASTTTIAARTNVVTELSTLLPGVTEGYISITSNRSLGAAIGMLSNNFTRLDFVSAAASGTALTFPALVTGVGDFATSIIIVNNNDADAAVTISANQAGNALATSTVTSIPRRSNLVRTLGELFPAGTNFTNLGFDANISVTSDQPLSGAATIGSAQAGLLATAIANAR